MTETGKKRLNLPTLPEGYVYQIDADPQMDGFDGNRWVRVSICKKYISWFTKKEKLKLIISGQDRPWYTDSPSHIEFAILRAGKQAYEKFNAKRAEDHPAAEYFGVYK